MSTALFMYSAEMPDHRQHQTEESSSVAMPAMKQVILFCCVAIVCDWLINMKR